MPMCVREGILCLWRVSNPSERIGVVIPSHSASIAFYGKSKKNLSNQNTQREKEVLNQWQFEYDDDDDTSERVHILCDCANKIDEAY